MRPTRSRPAEFVPAARDCIRTAGERVTAPRCAVLAVLLGADAALTHHEVEAAIVDGARVDRVTVYRVLDWLVARGFAHRIPGDDRAWRFLASRESAAQHHAHFTCSSCGRTVCLEEVAVPASVRLPNGFLTQGVEVMVKGICAACH